VRWLGRSGRGPTGQATPRAAEASPPPAPLGSAATQSPAGLRPLTLADIDAVTAAEALLYPYPWTRGNFIDALAAGYLMLGVFAPDGTLRAYMLAMAGVEEWHLLNLSVARDHQGQRLALSLLQHLEAHARATASPCLWLEVRPSNARARAVYERFGFEQIGVRRGYYPDLGGRREDALVLRRLLGAEASDAVD
jgi:[ribosomal protein S18]-alanine N-acetyltransferase